jgi:Uma2 family endonuclease
MADSAECLTDSLIENSEEDLGYEIRYEVIDNIAYMMSASPLHEVLVAEMIVQFGTYLKGKPCTVYGSNLEYNWVELLSEKGIHKPGDRKPKFLPDLSIICDKSKFKGGSYIGAPSLIVEVSSPSSFKFDVGRKKEIYEAVGVQEYWVIAYPYTVYQYVLEGTKYREAHLTLAEDISSVPVHIFPGLSIEFNKDEIDKENLS